MSIFRTAAGSRRLKTRRGLQIYDAEVRRLFGVYDALCAAGVPKEDARFVLPYGFHSNFFCSMNARELVHVMNELTYGRGAKYAELRALGESLFAQCEARLPFWPCSRGLPALAGLNAAGGAAVVPDAPVTGTVPPQMPGRKICDAYLLARGLWPAAATGGRADRASEDAPCPAPPPGAGTGELYAALRRLLSPAALTHLTRHRMQSPARRSCCRISGMTAMSCRSVWDKGMEAGHTAAPSELAAGRGAVARSRRGTSSPLLPDAHRRSLCSRRWRMRASFMSSSARAAARARSGDPGDAACQASPPLREVSPELFRLYGPTCFCTGKCPEGK